MRPIIRYIKKLGAQELGYRRGKLTTGQYIYISKSAVFFFPLLSSQITNDTARIVLHREDSSVPAEASYVWHNDKLSEPDGTRNEYRLYLNRDVAYDDYFFRPGDIVIFEKAHDKGKAHYYMKQYRETDPEYQELSEKVRKSKIRGDHALE
jgi:hypothetical protein